MVVGNSGLTLAACSAAPIHHAPTQVTSARLSNVLRVRPTSPLQRRACGGPTSTCCICCTANCNARIRAVVRRPRLCGGQLPAFEFSRALRRQGRVRVAGCSIAQALLRRSRRRKRHGFGGSCGAASSWTARDGLRHGTVNSATFSRSLSTVRMVPSWTSRAWANSDL